jgi:hypothetical protein
MSFPTIGDESATYDLRLALQGIDITLYLTILRKGHVLGILLYGDIGSAGLTEFQTLAEKAASKLS